MSDSRDDFNFPVPKFISRAFKGLLLPGQPLEDIFHKIGGLQFQESDIKIDERVWGSKTMTLEKKKPKTLDMFFSKIVKTVTSDPELKNSYTNLDMSCKNETSGNTQYSTSTKTSPKKMKIHKEENGILAMENKNMDAGKISKTEKSYHSMSPSEDESTESNSKMSVTYSEDMFAEEISNTNPKKLKKNNKVGHSVFDEENPSASQINKNISGFTSDNSSIIEDVSVRNKVYESPKENSLKRNSTRSDTSSEDEKNEQLQLPELDSIRDSMKNINEIFTELEPDHEKFSLGNLTKDDEVYILQCPIEVETKNLEGVELVLSGNSVVSIGNSENKYDCIFVKEKLKRHLYLATPDAGKEETKIGIYPLAGNIILSENFDLPQSEPIKDETLDEVKTEYIDESVTEDFLNQHVSKKKEKKKKYKSTEDEFKDGEALGECFSEEITEDVLNQLVSKKKKKKHKRLECDLGLSTL